MVKNMTASEHKDVYGHQRIFAYLMVAGLLLLCASGCNVRGDSARAARQLHQPLMTGQYAQPSTIPPGGLPPGVSGLPGGLPPGVSGGAPGGQIGAVASDPVSLGTQYIDTPPKGKSLKTIADPFGKYLVPAKRPPVPAPPRMVRLQWMPPVVPRPSRERELMTTPPNVERKPAPAQLGRFAGWLYNSEGQVVAIFEDGNRNTRAVRVDDLLMVVTNGRTRQMRVKAISPEYITLIDQATGDEQAISLQTDLNEYSGQ